VLLCERFGLSIAEVKELTLLQVKLLLQGAEKTDENSRYARMNDEARAVADKIKSRFGVF